MRNRSARLATLAAVLSFLAGLAVWGGVWVRTFASAPVVTVTRPVPAGEPLAPDALAVRPVPRSLVPEGALTDVEQAVGRASPGVLVPGEVVTSAKLSGAGAVTAKLPGEGLGLLSIPVTPARVLAGELRTGDLVHVLVGAPEGAGMHGSSAPPGSAPPAPGGWTPGLPASGAGTPPGGAWVLLRDVPVVGVQSARGTPVAGPPGSGHPPADRVPAAVILGVTEPQALALVDALSARAPVYLYVVSRGVAGRE